MKVFVDTNVWLAGRFGTGTCAVFLDVLVKAGVEILFDERVHAEFFRIAREKFRVEESVLIQAEVFFERHAMQVAAAELPVPGVPDADDALILAAALAAGAECFVTGDKALLALGKVEGMAIIDVRTAYLRVRGVGVG